MKNILLLHGWNYKNYNHIIKDKNAWHNRVKFVSELKKTYNVFILDMPGFGTEKTPKCNSWNLDDYSDFVNKYIITNKLDIDVIIGYSFGGAVAVNYKYKFNNSQKLILLSPAIIRNNNKSKNFKKTPKIFDKFRNILRDLYVIHIVKTNEMVYGNKFLRNTYQSIVRVELLDILNTFDKKDYLIIYGDKDNMVNPKKVQSIFKSNVVMIKDAGHDIANTHTSELINIINENTKN